MQTQADTSTLDMEIAMASLASKLREWAVLLDIDGTILDFAPTPRQVLVPPRLRHTLGRLKELTGGALALVSGRAVTDIDRIFAPLQLAAIGGHGAEFRPRPGTAPQQCTPSLGADVKRRLATVARLAPGIVVEDKDYSLALHYRQAPEQEPMLRAAIAGICAQLPAGAVEILPGKFVFEVKPTAVSKARAVAELMRCPPFADRRPIFVGDDTTDEPVFGVIADFGGLGFSVGRIVSGVDGHFDKPEHVRAWLARLVAEHERGDAA